MLLKLSRSAETTLIKQVYTQIRAKILNGDLAAGFKLPSTRELAADLGISRNVVIEAYELLLAEGYLVTRPGSGTHVANGAVLAEAFPAPQGGGPAFCQADQERRECIDFRTGLPALDSLPRKTWTRLTHQVHSTCPDWVYGYNRPEGIPDLRMEICRYLRNKRGVVCHPEQVVITSGAIQGISIAAPILLGQGGELVLEDPVSADIRSLFSRFNPVLCPIPVDEYGIRTTLLTRANQPVALFLTPSHQYPMGGNLPIQRRIEAVQFARQKGCYIIEDDYDSEFRYDGPPVSSLQGLAPEKVIYLSTFSKTLFPTLRLGYMIVPPELVERCREYKRISDNHTNSLNQLILARFIGEGYFERHVLKMKRLYRARRDALIENLHAQFPGRVQISGTTTGKHLVAAFDGVVFTKELKEKAEAAGVKIYPVEDHAIVKGAHVHELIFGYSHLTPEESGEGLRRLSRVI